VTAKITGIPYIITVNPRSQKNLDTLLLPITLPNVDRRDRVMN